jgi:hypothetical protein
MFKYLLFFIFIPKILLAQTCINPNWKHIEIDTQVKYKSTYIVETTYTPTIKDMLCVLGSDFLNNISQFPTNAILSIINLDLRSGYLVKWSLKENLFIIIKFDRQEGMANIYRYPLRRIGELLSNEDLPKPSKERMQLNYVKSILIKIDNKFLQTLLEED